ncbi:glutathione S-transferase C-terminal domain-containing protein, partial [Endozoicomonas sp. G2_2]|uniref:glutathione binding-like protein n=1 Tax=Endozoicomonas sp. G2_2 TaxID=2821092 RepID=UPI001ADCDD81
HGDLAGLADGATLSEYERGRQRIERLRQRQDRVFTERMLLNLKRNDVMQWLMFQMASIGPMLGQAHHFNKYAPEKIDYAVKRYESEANRLYGVMDRRLADFKFLAGNDYSIADIATWPWLRSAETQGVNIDDYPNVRRWFEMIGDRENVKKGLQVLADHHTDLSKDKDALENMFGSKQYEER